MGFAKGIPLAVLRGVLRSFSSVEGDLGSHSEEQGEIAFCSWDEKTYRHALLAKVLSKGVLYGKR